MGLWAKAAITMMGVSLFVWAFQASAATATWPPGTSPAILSNTSGINLGAFNVNFNSSTNNFEVNQDQTFNTALAVAIAAFGVAIFAGATVGIGSAFVVGSFLAGVLAIFNGLFFAPVRLLSQANAPWPLVVVVGGTIVGIYIVGVTLLLARQS